MQAIIDTQSDPGSWALALEAPCSFRTVIDAAGARPRPEGAFPPPPRAGAFRIRFAMTMPGATPGRGGAG